jgi:putative alpha-1,2-mannosidase
LSTPIAAIGLFEASCDPGGLSDPFAAAIASRRGLLDCLLRRHECARSCSRIAINRSRQGMGLRFKLRRGAAPVWDLGPRLMHALGARRHQGAQAHEADAIRSGRGRKARPKLGRTPADARREATRRERSDGTRTRTSQRHQRLGRWW